MKKFLLTALAGLGAFAAFPAQMSDFCGDFQSTFIDEWQNPQMLMITISEGQAEGKVRISGLYSPASLGVVPLEADVDLEAGTLTIPFTDLSAYSSDLSFYRGTWRDGGLYDMCKDPVVGTLGEDGKIRFDEGDVFIFGGYSDNEDECYMYAVQRKVTFSPVDGDLVFKYNEDEWTHIGTALYPDLCFGYKTYDTADPYITTVDVVQNKLNPMRIALLDPYRNDHWASVNKDSEAVGQIVIDLTDPELVVIEPYVYSGFTYNYGGLDLGRTYIYNNEGYYVKVAGMTTLETQEFLSSMGQEVCTFDGMNIYLAYGSMIFATESKPTQKYSFHDNDSVIELDDDVQTAIENAGSGVCPVGTSVDVAVEYYDLTGNKVSKPASGNMYICRRGDRAVKVMF